MFPSSLPIEPRSETSFHPLPKKGRRDLTSDGSERALGPNGHGIDGFGMPADLPTASSPVDHDGLSETLPAFTDDDDSLRLGVPSEIVRFSAEQRFRLQLEDLVRAGDIPYAQGAGRI